MIVREVVAGVGSEVLLGSIVGCGRLLLLNFESEIIIYLVLLHNFVVNCTLGVKNI